MRVNSEQSPASIVGPLFLVIEGIDGSGKSSLVKALTQEFFRLEVPHKASREPSDGPHGRRLRELMMTERLPPEEELDLFIQDRKHHIETCILPSLSRGEVVLLDRYFYSTVAYQGAGGYFRPQTLEQMMAFAPVPDLVFLLDISPEDALQRLAKDRGNKFSEYETLGMLTRCRSIFLDMAERRREICEIDATLNPDEILSAVIRKIHEHVAEIRERDKG